MFDGISGRFSLLRLLTFMYVQWFIYWHLLNFEMCTFLLDYAVNMSQWDQSTHNYMISSYV